MSKTPLGERERIARIICPHAFEFRQGRRQPRQDRSHNREIALAKADLILSAPALPGWKLVPVEPTEEMRDAGYLAATIDFDVLNPDCANPVWAAMLSAALLPEEGQGLSPSQSLREAAELAKWRFEFIAKQLRRQPDLAGMAPSLEEAAADLAKALSTPPATPALGLIEGEQGSSNASPGQPVAGRHGPEADAELSAHPDWHLCCAPSEAMLGAGYIDASGERQDLTPDEMRSLWFRMHAAIRRDA